MITMRVTSSGNVDEHNASNHTSSYDNNASRSHNYDDTNASHNTGNDTNSSNNIDKAE